MTTLRALLLLFLGLCPGFAYSEEFPPRGFTELYSEESPEATFKIIHFQRDPKDFSSDSQIWLQSLKPECKTQLLFTHNNRASWLISPDDSCIAINHHAMSTDGLLQIFARGKDGVFTRVEKDFREAAFELMAAQLKSKPDLDHFYCYADTWLRENVLLAHLVGHESGVQSLDPWYFIYDVSKDRFSWDLSDINKDALKR